MKLSETLRWLLANVPEDTIEEHGQDIEEAATAAAKLEAELAAHLENEGDECPLCLLEAENEELRELFVYFFGENYEELAKG